jgi:hypothetical protein
MKPNLRDFCKRLASSPRWLSAVGVLSAGVIAVQANVLVARYYERWDFTSQGAYTLSHPTRALLESLQAPVEVTVLIPRSDRLIIDARHMLDAYRAVSPELEVRYVDPDSQPAEFMALQQRHGISAGQTQDGRLVTDASFIVSQGERHHFVSTDDLVSVDDQGRARPRLEATLTEGIAHVVMQDSEKICFAAGFGALSVDDAGPHGLAELQHRLKRSNFDVDVVELEQPGLESRAFTGCSVAVLAGPERPVTDAVQRALSGYLEAGGNLLLLLPPAVDEDGRIEPSGLEPLTKRVGIVLDERFVIDPDPARRLPQGVGEAFFAEPKVHPITEGLARDEARIDARPLVVATRPLGVPGDSHAVPLLTSSAQSFAVGDLRPLEAAGGVLRKAPTDLDGPFPVAMAVELPKAAAAVGASEKPRGARLVVGGTASLAYNANYRDESLFGARLFTENAISWLAARPALVSVPEKEGFTAGLTLTEDSLAEVRNYVLVYMPLTAVLGGIFILLRRRRTERKSREEAT